MLNTTNSTLHGFSEEVFKFYLAILYIAKSKKR